MDIIDGISYYLDKIMFTVIKHVVNHDIICLSATQLMHEFTFVAQNSQLHFP